MRLGYAMPKPSRGNPNQVNKEPEYAGVKLYWCLLHDRSEDHYAVGGTTSKRVGSLSNRIVCYLFGERGHAYAV